jgi:hypothetical protein
MSVAVQPDLESSGFVAHNSTPDDIFGWFDYENVYDRAVDSAPPGAVLVEVGVFLGKSLVYLAERARAADKGLRVYGVDTWRGSPEFDGTVWFNGKPINEHPGEVLIACYANLIARGLADDVTLIVSDSAKAARLFADSSVHMVFLDAAHDEGSVSRDLAAWHPKVKAGGLFAGHDYREEDGFPGVKRAVDRVFGGRVRGIGSWWEVTP